MQRTVSLTKLSRATEADWVETVWPKPEEVLFIGIGASILGTVRSRTAFKVTVAA